MKKTLENVHVVIYGKKMLKEAVSRLGNAGYNICSDIFQDYKPHGNDCLIFHDNKFKLVQFLPKHPNYEVTLNDVIEMVISLESSPILKIGDYIYSELKKSPNNGFSVFKVTLQDTVDYHCDPNSLHRFKVIPKEQVDKLRKEFCDQS